MGLEYISVLEFGFTVALAYPGRRMLLGFIDLCLFCPGASDSLFCSLLEEEVISNQDLLRRLRNISWGCALLELTDKN